MIKKVFDKYDESVYKNNKMLECFAKGKKLSKANELLRVPTSRRTVKLRENSNREKIVSPRTALILSIQNIIKHHHSKKEVFKQVNNKYQVSPREFNSILINIETK